MRLLGLRCFCRLSLVAVSWALLCCGILTAGFSLWWLVLLWSTALGAPASVVAAGKLNGCNSWALEHWLSICDVQA